MAQWAYALLGMNKYKPLAYLTNGNHIKISNETRQTHKYIY